MRVNLILKGVIVGSTCGIVERNMFTNALGYTDPVWKAEDGETYKIKDFPELRPVVDAQNGRLFAITKLGSVVLINDYGVDRRRSARDAAIFFWGDPSGWKKIDEKVVHCTCCAEPVTDLGTVWRITVIESGLLKARHPDEGKGVLGEHTIFESPYVDPDSERVTRANDIATFAIIVGLFGEIFDMHSGEIQLPYSELYKQQ
jgi:hypothetical protein